MQAIETLLPGASHRFCVRHLYANFRKRFPSANLMRLMWKVAKCTYPQAWEREMIKIDINDETFKYLIQIPQGKFQLLN